MMNFDSPNAQPFFLQGGEHGVLLMHGFTGSPAHMRPLGDALCARGYTVRGIRLSGHGTTVEDMRRASWHQWLSDAGLATEELRKTCKYVTVCGLSMGGVLSLLMAQTHELTAVVPISAPMYTTNRFTWAAPLVSAFKPIMAWKGNDPNRETLTQAYDIGYDSFPAARVRDLNLLMRKARQNLFAVSCPTLVVQSRMDKTVRADSADIIIGGVRAQKKETLWLRHAPHVCTISPELPDIVEKMDAFLRDCEG